VTLLAAYHRPAADLPAAPRLRLPGWVEPVMAVLVLLLLSEALLGPLFNPLQKTDAAPWLRQIWLPVYGLTAVACLSRPRMMLGVAWGALLLAPLLILAKVSEQWSIMPDITGRRALALALSSTIGLYLAARFTWRELVNMLAAVFLILAVGSYVSVLVAPAWAIHADIHPGAWKALWFEKNGLGQIMTWGVLACGSAALLTPERRRLWIAGAVLCASLVLFSTSKTSLLGTLLVVAGLVAIAGFQRGRIISVATAWAALVGAAVVVGLTVFAPEILLEALGKDPTLTGRTDIWSAVLRRVEERPWQGYGYAAFWADKGGPVGYVRNEVDWNAPTAHNGWLELLLAFGWTGVLLFGVHLAVTAAAAGVSLVRGPHAYWTAPAIVLFILFSLSESTIMQQNNLLWVLYVMTSAKLLQLGGGSKTRQAAAERATSAAP
jgi:O-antigen ligase